MTDTIPQVTLKPLTWTPHLPPVEIEAATPRQLEAMKVTPSAKKVSPYVRTLAHDPDSYVARTVLFNAIMYAEGGLNRADRELGALGASLINGCKHLRQRACPPACPADRHRHDLRPLCRAPRCAEPARCGDHGFRRGPDRHAADGGPVPCRALRAQGMEDAEIQDLIHSIAIFGWANRLMHPLGHSD